METISKRGGKNNNEKVTDHIDIFWPTYMDTRFQHSDHSTITVGSSSNGSSSLHISNYFENGTSNVSETYSNPPLSRNKFFKIKRFECWGFDWL